MKRTYATICLFILLIACEKQSITSPQVEEEITTRIVSYEHTISFSGPILKFFARGFTDLLDDHMLKDIQGIKIIYKTVDQNNDALEASGMLMIPKDFDGNGPLVSFQHGTLSNDSQAPSNSPLGVNELTSASLIAGMGAVVAVPDYVGYGHSSDHKHPYQLKENTAQSTYDFLLASQEYLKRKRIETNGDLFLTGYSQGGHATLALHQKIEKENQLRVTHSISGAGAYNVTAFSREILTKDQDLPFMGNYVWVMEVFNSMYPSLQRPMDFYFNEPYATRLSQIKEINQPLDLSLIHPNPQKLFKKEVRENLINGKDPALLKVIALQDVFDWKPEAPVTLFHGTADDFVYPSNTLAAQAHIQARGGDVRYVPLEGLDHQEAVIPYLLGTFKIIFPQLN